MTAYRPREIVPRIAAALEDMPVVVLTDSRCRAAILAYGGSTIASLGDRLWALPIDVLLR